MEYLYKGEFARFSWDETIHAGILQWKGTVAGEEFRTPLLQSLELIRKRNAKKILNDGSKMGPVPQADEEWMNNVLMPQLVTIGIKYLALILPVNNERRLENRRNIQAMMDSIPLTIEFFDNIKEARAWLKDQQ